MNICFCQFCLEDIDGSVEDHYDRESGTVVCPSCRKKRAHKKLTDL